SYEYQQSIEQNTRIIIGVNQFTMEEPPFDKVFSIDDSIRQLQIDKLKKLRAERDEVKVQACLKTVSETAKGTGNLMPPIIDAVENYATLGEIADAMRKVFGEF
nr:methylmalonyl-CoA mutase [Bacteroidia bacterium]